jgi:hypothetical protein
MFYQDFGGTELAGGKYRQRPGLVERYYGSGMLGFYKLFGKVPPNLS